MNSSRRRYEAMELQDAPLNGKHQEQQKDMCTHGLHTRWIRQRTTVAAMRVLYAFIHAHTQKVKMVLYWSNNSCKGFIIYRWICVHKRSTYTICHSTYTETTAIQRLHVRVQHTQQKYKVRHNNTYISNDKYTRVRMSAVVHTSVLCVMHRATKVSEHKHTNQGTKVIQWP